MRLKRAFTIVELLTVLAVLALLVGLLIPSLIMARNAARVAKQRVQLASIDQALLAFRNDDGDYPPLPPKEPDTGMPVEPGYCGAQMLAEAFFGLDLLGYYPETSWNGDISEYTMGAGSVLADRKKRYLDLESVDVVTVNDLYGEKGQIGQLVSGTYVICDVFGRMDVTIGTEQKKVGLPILYFKADPSKFSFSMGTLNDNVYDIRDNLQLIVTQMLFDQNVNNLPANAHKIMNNFFLEEYKIVDPKITTKNWPHRPDSYILISAGLDGLYGTSDDITNFGR